MPVEFAIAAQSQKYSILAKTPVQLTQVPRIIAFTISYSNSFPIIERDQVPACIKVERPVGA